MTAGADNALNADDKENCANERALLVLHVGRTTNDRGGEREQNTAAEMANGLNALRQCAGNDEEADSRRRFLLPANTLARRTIISLLARRRRRRRCRRRRS